jgi:hypothetical protein
MTARESATHVLWLCPAQEISAASSVKLRLISNYTTFSPSTLSSFHAPDATYSREGTCLSLLRLQLELMFSGALLLNVQGSFRAARRVRQQSLQLGNAYASRGYASSSEPYDCVVIGGGGLLVLVNF